MAYMPLDKSKLYLETDKMTKIWDLSQPWGWDTPLWPFPGARSDLLCEDFDSVVKSQVTHRGKELSGGAYVQSDVCIVISSCFVPCLLTQLNCSGYDLCNIVKLEFVGTESVRVYDVASGFEIHSVQHFDIVGPRQVPGLGKLSAFETELLKYRAGASVTE